MLFVLWFVSALIIDMNYFVQALPYFSFLIAVIVLDFIRGIILDDPTTKLLGINKMPLLIWPVLLQFYYNRVQMLKFPLIIAVSAVTISAIFTLKGNIAYPGASRLLAGATEYYAEIREFYRSMNIGGYGLVFGMVFMLMPLILLCKYRTKGKVLIFFIIVFYLINILYASFFFAIIFSVFLIIISNVNVKKKRSVLIVSGIILLITIIIRNGIGDILINIANKINSEILVKRITQLFSGEYFLEYGDSNNRLTIYMNAIKNWLDRPILGSLQGGAIEYRRSGHSALLGYLEHYGLIAFLYYRCFYNIYKKTCIHLKSAIIKNYWFVFYMFFLIFALVENIDTFGEIGCVVFFIAPAIFLYLDNTIICKYGYSEEIEQGYNKF